MITFIIPNNDQLKDGICAYAKKNGVPLFCLNDFELLQAKENSIPAVKLDEVCDDDGDKTYIADLSPEWFVGRVCTKYLKFQFE